MNLPSGLWGASIIGNASALQAAESGFKSPALHAVNAKAQGIRASTASSHADSWVCSPPTDVYGRFMSADRPVKAQAVNRLTWETG